MILNANGRMRPVWLFTRFTLSLELFICLTRFWAWCFFFQSLTLSIFSSSLCFCMSLELCCYKLLMLFETLFHDLIHSFTHSLSSDLPLFVLFFLFHMHWFLSSFLRSQKVLICANFWWFRSPYCTCSFGNVARYCNGCVFFLCVSIYLYRFSNGVQLIVHEWW